jgi:hypothetical protein
MDARVAIPKLAHRAHVRVSRAKLGAVSKKKFRMELEIRIERNDVRVEVKNLALDDEDFPHLWDALTPIITREAVGAIPIVDGFLHDNDIIPSRVVHFSIQPEFGSGSNLAKFWRSKTR